MPLLSRFAQRFVAWYLTRRNIAWVDPSCGCLRSPDITVGTPCPEKRHERSTPKAFSALDDTALLRNEFGNIRVALAITPVKGMHLRVTRRATFPIERYQRNEWSRLKVETVVLIVQVDPDRILYEGSDGYIHELPRKCLTTQNMELLPADYPMPHRWLAPA